MPPNCWYSSTARSTVACVPASSPCHNCTQPSITRLVSCHGAASGVDTPRAAAAKRANTSGTPGTPISSGCTRPLIDGQTSRGWRSAIATNADMSGSTAASWPSRAWHQARNEASSAWPSSSSGSAATASSQRQASGRSPAELAASTSMKCARARLPVSSPPESPVAAGASSRRARSQSQRNHAQLPRRYDTCGLPRRTCSGTWSIQRSSVAIAPAPTSDSPTRRISHSASSHSCPLRK